jgi:hypothetical protein
LAFSLLQPVRNNNGRLDPKKNKGAAEGWMIPHLQLRHDPLAPDSWWSVPWIATAIVMLAIGLFVFLVLF